MNIAPVGSDLIKNFIQMHGLNDQPNLVARKKLLAIKIKCRKSGHYRVGLLLGIEVIAMLLSPNVCAGSANEKDRPKYDRTVVPAAGVLLFPNGVVKWSFIPKRTRADRPIFGGTDQIRVTISRSGMADWTLLSPSELRTPPRWSNLNKVPLALEIPDVQAGFRFSGSLIVVMPNQGKATPRILIGPLLTGSHADSPMIVSVNGRAKNAVVLVNYQSGIDGSLWEAESHVTFDMVRCSRIVGSRLVPKVESETYDDVPAFEALSPCQDWLVNKPITWNAVRHTPFASMLSKEVSFVPHLKRSDA